MSSLLLKTLLISVTLLGAQSVIADGKAVFVSPDQVTFDDIIPGTVAFVTIFGERGKGAHGDFVRIPAGQAAALRTHGGAYNAVVLAGIFKNPIPGIERSNAGITSGSYYKVPAFTKHISRCAETRPVDCLTFIHQSVPFDFVVAE